MIWSRDLFRGLYQGIGIVVLATLPAAGTFFTTYEAAKSFIGGLGSRPRAGHGPDSGVPVPRAAVHSAASAIAECASCLVLTPAEVVKQNAQMIRRQERLPSSPHSASTSRGRSTSLEALRQLAAGEGTGRRLLSGYTALVARNLPFTAIQFPAFEALRARIWQSRGSGSGSPGTRAGLLETGVVTGTSAGLAGSFAAVVTTPMDVVKTRMMLSPSDTRYSGKGGEAVEGVHSEAGADKRGYGRQSRGGLAVARQVVIEKGVTGLFRGSVIRAVWTAVGSGLYIGMYEVSRIWLTRRRGEDVGEDSIV